MFSSEAETNPWPSGSESNPAFQYNIPREVGGQPAFFMSLHTTDFMRPTYISALLASGVPVFNRLSNIPMEAKNSLKSAECRVFAESQTMTSGAPTKFANILIALGTSDSDLIWIIQTNPNQ